MEAGNVTAMDASDFHSRAGDCSTEDFKSVKDENVPPEGSLEEEAPEAEEEESGSAQEMSAERQRQLLREFDAVHDEAQQLRIMNLLLQCRVRRFMQQRRKVKGALSSTFFTSAQASPLVGDAAVMTECLEKELLQAGEVRRQLQAESERSAVEEDLRQRLATARHQVVERAAQLQQLQDKLLARLRGPPARRQEAERLLKRVWPQLLRLRKERLLHSRARQELESAQQEVAGLEVLGPRRSVAGYEELEAERDRLRHEEQHRAEQVAALRGEAEASVQLTAQLREALQGERRSVLLARRRDERATAALRAARQQVVESQKQRNELYKEKCKVTREMELLAYPNLLRDHAEVRKRLRATQAELEALRTTYALQEQRIAAVRRLMLQRERGLEGRSPRPRPQPEPPFQEFRLPAKRGRSALDVKRDC